MSMYTEPTNVPASQHEPSISNLLGGIVNDVQRLLKQHVELLREEVRQGVRKTKRGALAFAGALLLAIVGAAFAMTFLVGLLAWAVPAVPWWGWSGILGLAFIILAFALVQAGKKSIAHIGVENTAQELKEDMQWLKK